MPFPFSKAFCIDGLQQLLVKSLKFGIDGLRGTATELDGKSNLPALELPFMEEFGSGERGDGHGRCSALLRREGCRSPGLIVILDETDQLILVIKDGAKMKTDTLGILVLQAIVQPLVVAEIKPLLLKLLLKVPVGFRHEEEMGVLRTNGLDHLWPVIG